jgi:hypothetical protein
MTNRPILTVFLPWEFTGLAKTVQARAKGNDQVSIGGDREGMRITATVQEFLRLGLGRQDWDISDAMVGRLRSARMPVKASRTVRLPGRITAVEISTDLDSHVAKKVAGVLAQQGSSDVVTVYDRDGAGHTGVSAGLKGKEAQVVGMAPRVTQGAPRPNGRVAKESSKRTGLIEAIRNVYETNGDDFAMLLDWDDSSYETPDLRDLIRGVLPQYLTDAQREEWDGMEQEQQTAVLRQALQWHEIQETAETLNAHFENTMRGASRTPKTLQASPDPLDLGLKDPENLVRLSRQGSINELFE